jgi:hypothetical protein
MRLALLLPPAPWFDGKPPQATPEKTSVLIGHINCYNHYRNSLDLSSRQLLAVGLLQVV